MEPSPFTGGVYILVDRYGGGVALGKFSSTVFSREFDLCCVRTTRWDVVLRSLAGAGGDFGRVRAAEVR